MFDAPADAWYVWVAVAVASVAVAGVAFGLPSSPPPDANAAANAVDRAAGNPHDATATYDHDAGRYAVDRNRISLRNEGGAAHATVAFGPVTPAAFRDDLTAVLSGEAPGDRFATPTAFAAAAERAREDADGEWREASGTVRARTVTWGDVRVTLVEA